MEKARYYSEDYFNEEDKKRLARMLMLSRAESKMSQEKVAMELGIAKKTVQNWERGVSAPTLPQAIEWFRVMRVAPMPYMLQFIFPEMENISKNDSDEKLRKELIRLIETMPGEGVRQLMYLFYGDHGSSPRANLNMLTAHLQTPLRDRYNHARVIADDYKLAADKESVTGPNHIQPDTEFLDKAIEKARESILINQSNYAIIK